MELFEKTLKSETVFDGRIIHVRRDRVELPDGREASREVVDHHGGVCVLALDENGCVPLVRQFRYPYEEVVCEIPAGKLELGEDPLTAAERELREETGCVAEELCSLGRLYPSPGYCGEIIHMYLARGLTFGEAELDEGEFLNMERLPFDDVVSMVMSGEIKDAKTIAAVLKTKLLLGL